MENLQIAWQVFLGGLGVVVLMGGAVAVLARWFDALKKPKETIESEIEEIRQEVAELKKELAEHHGKLMNDHERISDLVDSSRIQNECMLQLLNHAIDNNHIDQMVEARDSLQHYLINK